MSRSYRDISRWATIRIVSRRIDTVSIYRHIVSSLLASPTKALLVMMIDTGVEKIHSNDRLLFEDYGMRSVPVTYDGMSSEPRRKKIT